MSDLDIDKDTMSAVEDIFGRMNPKSEFEVMFNNYRKGNALSLERFQHILDYMNAISKAKKKKITSTSTLDVIYSPDDTRYRVTLSGIDTINEYITMVHKKKNHVALQVFMKRLDSDDNISVGKKVRDASNIKNIDDYDIRVRMSDEDKITKAEIEKLSSVTHTDNDKIMYRYKQRLSMNLSDNSSHDIILDATTVKMSNNINKVQSSAANYEVELEYASKKPEKGHLKLIFQKVQTLLKVLQQTRHIVSNTVANMVLDKYRSLLGVNDNINNLDARRAQSLEIQHVVDKLPNKYAVTDKADGERYFLIIMNMKVYLISYNLAVKGTGITLSSTLNDHDNTILDGEYIFIPSQNRHIFMVFDCLYNGSTDVRKNNSLITRLTIADKVIDKCFIMKGQKGNTPRFYDGPFDMKKIKEFHKKEISKHIAVLNNDMKESIDKLLIRRKYFIPVLGGSNNEIFKYTDLLWNAFIYDNSNNCPYTLDGVMYHPLEQKYTTKEQDNKYVEYKMKPPEKNSIDFYIEYEKNRDTGRILTLYDNSNDNYVKSRPYRICNLYVGRNVGGREQPVLFQEEDRKYRAYIFLNNGAVRDIDGNIINDKTVVEFYYNMDSSIPDTFRWIPIRTRYDKTESVIRFRRRYGNYESIANRVWRSIVNPFTFNDIKILGDDSQYDKYINKLRGKIDHSLILSEKKENKYYQIRTNLAKPMRQFHNWIKSILIYTHCDHSYEHRKLKILDIGCGRGNDIMKFYHTTIEYSVGIDVDNDSIQSPIDGATSRYQQLQKSYPNFPRMFFIHADAGAILDYNSQTKAVGAMSSRNKALLLQHFGKDAPKYDRINCQLTLQYMLENTIIWENFCDNIKNNLASGGYAIFTCFDARKVIDYLEDMENKATYYTDDEGEKRILFEIVRKFSKGVTKSDMIGTGVCIDVHNAMELQEGVYVSEYLVDGVFIEKEFDKRCDMDLIDTDTFGNQFTKHSDYFNNIIKYEENPKTRQFLTKTAEFYESDNGVNKASYSLNSLYRYYIFRKR